MDENLSLDILYGDEYVPDELYQLVRHGLCSQLSIRLHELSHSIEYITALRWYNQEQLSLLMVAALNGYDDIVRVLLTHCDPINHIELKGQIMISDDKCIEGATALYCACYRGHFTVAKTLIELGHANPNADNYDYPKCPLLIYATSMDRLDIVRFLIENRYSDVNETKSTDIDQCTALIWASHRGYPVLVKYLIKHGADVNYSCPSEYLTAQTPICCATLRGHVGSVRLLYNAGANTNIRNNSGETLLMTAVRLKYYSIIAFLLKQSINTIEDLELAVCSLIKISSSYENMTLTFELLKFTLRKRQSMNIQKVCIGPMAAYNYEQECQTVDELNAIKDDRDRIYIETLLIRERLFLSRNDITIIKPLHAYGDMLVNKEEFDKCLEVWIHMFYLYQQMKLETILHRFVWLFCRMLTAKHIIPVEGFLRVCQLIFEPSQREDKTVTLGNALFLVIIATKILEQEGITKEEKTSIFCWVKDLCRHRLTTTDGRTLLHTCIDAGTNGCASFRSRDISRYLKFPNISGLRLLLACGSRWLDIDAVIPYNRNTPLHLICQETEDRQIIELLLNSGCHRDCVNKYGRIPADYVQDEKIRALLIPKPIPLNLKCLCARIIANKGLNADSLGTSTSALNKFIILHGGNSCIQSGCD